MRIPTSGPVNPECEFYISTLAILAPWRNQGIASALLREVISAAAAFTNSTAVGDPGPGLGPLRGVFAHVWETNDEGLEWYRGRGFEIGDVVAGYYRKLRPDGARIVRRGVLGVLLDGGGIGRRKDLDEQELGKEP